MDNLENTYIDRLFATYGEYGIDRELIERLFTDGTHKQGFTSLEVYNLLRMSLGHEYGEREYFAVSEVAAMLGMTENEVMNAAEKQKQGMKPCYLDSECLFRKG